MGFGGTTPLDPERARRHKRAMPEDVSALSFEDALKRLESIVARLESGEASLDESIKLYSEGDALRAQCDARLKDAQMRIEKISLGPDGAPRGIEPFDER
jgi:exodeoxyribonuclease VII small subunit